MQIKDLSETRREVFVSLAKDKVSKEKNSVLAKLKNEASVPGFRKGHAPIDMIKQRFKDTIENKVLQNLISESLFDILKKQGWNYLGMPDIRNALYKEDGSLEYTAIVEILPKIELKNYLNLKLEKKIFLVSEEEVDEALKNLQKKWAEFIPVKDRLVRENDIVVLDFEAFHKDKHVKGGKVQGFIVRIGEKKFFKEVEEKLIGCNVGEKKDILTKFSEDFADKKLAGEDVLFKIDIKTILEEKLPELDDNFANRIGNFKNLEELKNNLREELKKTKEKISDIYLRENSRKYLATDYQFEPPESLVGNKLENIIRDAEIELQSKGVNFDMTKDNVEKLREKYKDEAKNQVKASLVLKEIANKENITISPEEIEGEVKKIASVWRKGVEETKNILEGKNLLSLIEDDIKERKALDYIIQKAEIKEIEN